MNWTDQGDWQVLTKLGKEIGRYGAYRDYYNNDVLRVVIKEPFSLFVTAQDKTEDGVRKLLELCAQGFGIVVKLEWDDGVEYREATGSTILAGTGKKLHSIQLVTKLTDRLDLKAAKTE